MSDLVGNPEDRFSRVAAHIAISQCHSTMQVVDINIIMHGGPTDQTWSHGTDEASIPDIYLHCCSD